MSATTLPEGPSGCGICIAYGYNSACGARTSLPFFIAIVLLCKLSQRNDGADKKGFESVNAVLEDYGDADCVITLARSTLTFFRPRHALGN
jgi:hypothetical protein